MTMKRREFITLLGGAAAAGVAVGCAGAAPWRIAKQRITLAGARLAKLLNDAFK